MARIETVRLTIDSGLTGLEGPVRIRFNGHELELNRVSGGTGAGETYVGEFLVGSVGHGIELLGPEGPAGPWEIRSLTVELEMVEGPTTKWQAGGLRLPAGGARELLEGLDGQAQAFEV